MITFRPAVFTSVAGTGILWLHNNPRCGFVSEHGSANEAPEECEQCGQQLDDNWVLLYVRVETPDADAAQTLGVGPVDNKVSSVHNRTSPYVNIMAPMREVLRQADGL